MRRVPILSLAAALALLIVTLVIGASGWLPETPLLFAPESVPVADFGLGWSERASPPDAPRGDAMRHLLRVLTVVTAASGAIAAGTFVLIVAVRGVGRRREMAVRYAVGAHRGMLRVSLLREAVPGLLIAGVVGAATGVGALLFASASWPGASVDPLLGTALSVSMVAAVGFLLLIAVPASVLPARLAEGATVSLSTGERATRDRYEGGARRLFLGIQMTVTLALLAGAVLATRSGNPDTGDTNSDAELTANLLVLPLEPVREGTASEGASGDWPRLVSQLGALPAVQLQAVASAGSWADLGTVDFTLADCGDCVIGGLPLRFLGSRPRHHAVSGSFFDTAGLAVLDGRTFDASDRLEAPQVAVVSLTFARSVFKNGDPVGRIVRLGGSPDRWYTVIGVVEDSNVATLGRGARPTGSVYVSADRHPPDRLEVAVRVTDDAQSPVLADALGVSGFRLTGPIRTLRGYLDAQAAPLRWWGRVQSVAVVVAFLLALLGIHHIARLEGQARRRELAVRAALGAPRSQLVWPLLGGVVRTAGIAGVVAVPGAIGVTAAVQHVAAGVPLFDPVLYLVTVFLVTGSAVLGTLTPALRASRAQPAEAFLEREVVRHVAG